MPVRNIDGCLCVFLLDVCVGTTFVSMLGHFQVLMALPETQCECCVVSVIVCVCLCVFQNPLCMPVRKIPWVFVCVSLYVCVGTTFVNMLGQFQVLMALLETQ